LSRDDRRDGGAHRPDGGSRDAARGVTIAAPHPTPFIPEDDSMPRCQPRLHAASACLLVMAIAVACGSDDAADRAASDSATTTSTVESPTTSTTAAPTTTVPDVPTEDVRFTSDDGVELAGRIYGNGTTAIVCSHMRNRSKADYASAGPLLASEGFTVLAYDNRGDGESGQGDRSGRVRDVLAAIELVRSRGAETVFLVGASRGGGLSLEAAVLAPVDGVVTLSAAPPADGPAAVAAVTAPSLYVNSENDDFAQTTQEMYDAANQPKELQMYPGGDHGVALFNSQPDLIERIATFVRAHGGA
jgi:uncharacterized protein